MEFYLVHEDGRVEISAPIEYTRYSRDEDAPKNYVRLDGVLYRIVLPIEPTDGAIYVRRVVLDDSTYR